MLKKLLSGLSIVLFMGGIAFGAHPLISDDTGTQGKGKFQIEVNSELAYDREREDGLTVIERGGELATILSYGITGNIDFVLGIPYQWFRVKEDGSVMAKGYGISDISLEMKWRFYEKDNLSLALKPGITLPTGDEDKGLGNGRASYGLVFITTKELEPWAFHFNLGYTHNEYKLHEDDEASRKGIWHVSLASEVEAAKDVMIVGNIGVERNPDRNSNTHPAFILGGVIYSLNENLDMNAGIKGGLNKPETDIVFLAGIALKF